MKTLRLESPSRIDVMSKKMMEDIDVISLIRAFDLSIEEPLPNAKERGVFKVIFLDKHRIYNNNIYWVVMS